MSLETLKISTLGSLSGKVALVTGGGTGLGLTIAKTFLANGAAKVYITGRRLEVLQKAAEEFQGLVPIQMDVTSKESITSGVKVVQENDGKLDILVNNAGAVGQPFFGTGEIIDTTGSYGQAFFKNESFEGWAKTFSTNTSSVFFVTMAFLDLLVQSANERRREGDGSETASVINISASAASSHLGLYIYSYCVSKVGLNHLTSVLATEFALKEIPVRVNAIVPGLFASEANTGTPGGVETLAKSTIPGAVNPIPLRRPGRDGELGGAAVYLASDAGSYSNGNMLHVDGGHVLVNP
ncbi:short chain dehydrogenase reductase family protein [Moniliophthora roreri MCA 2997]|uniref:Short chain dehydrogenase reductase family protein n=2 Tax=Moniliophthora roreri TaxID=221103 RepID=V2YQ27_MONRO|nr:short chain dehydrogenase reductase family protein [Moniliophthora roreri MCA 2997]KAI3604845.1 short chain dehydrogenase reductase family protein [Moniliophthora roreri]